MVKGVPEATAIWIRGFSPSFTPVFTLTSPPCPLDEREWRFGGEQSDDYSTRRARMALYVRRLRDEKELKRRLERGMLPGGLPYPRVVFSHALLVGTSVRHRVGFDLSFL